MDRAVDLRRDYDLLGGLLVLAEGSGAAAIAAQRRLIGAELETLEKEGEVSLVDELAVKRAAAGSSRPPARRKSG